MTGGSEPPRGFRSCAREKGRTGRSSTRPVHVTVLVSFATYWQARSFSLSDIASWDRSVTGVEEKRWGLEARDRIGASHLLSATLGPRRGSTPGDQLPEMIP